MTRYSRQNDLTFMCRTTDKIYCKFLGQRRKISNWRDCLQTHCDTSWWIHCYFPAVINDNKKTCLITLYHISLTSASEKMSSCKFSFSPNFLFFILCYLVQRCAKVEVTKVLTSSFLSSSSSHHHHHHYRRRCRRRPTNMRHVYFKVP